MIASQWNGPHLENLEARMYIIGLMILVMGIGLLAASFAAGVYLELRDGG
jgi:hypothetical protein